MQINEETVVKIENVSYKYNREFVLEDITLDIKKGEFVGLIGPNGSGKTTLLKIILGRLKPTKGSVYLFDKNVDEFNGWERVGYVPQKSGSQVFNFPVTVSELVDMGRIGRDKNKIKTTEEALEAVGMGKFKSRLLNELSGGQAQRVFIARAIVGSPELLVLDEPTSGVDIEAQTEFYALLRKLNKELNLTLILVSHDVDFIASEVTTIACLNKKLICHLPPKEFLEKNYLEKVYGQSLRHVVHDH